MRSSPLRMVRLRYITDPDLKAKIVRALAERRGLPASAIPDWYELDDADFVDLLNDIREADAAGGESAAPHDPRE